MMSITKLLGGYLNLIGGTYNFTLEEGIVEIIQMHRDMVGRY